MKINKKDKNKKINRRLMFFGGIKLFSILFILERLYDLQIRQSDKYKKLADNNRINLRFILPSRGIIYDRHGNILADNKEQYQLIYRNDNSKKKIDHLFRILQYVKLDDDKKSNIMNAFDSNKKDFIQMVVKNNLSWEEVAKISSNITELRGVFIEMVLVRYYKSIPSSHIIGYVTKPNRTDFPKLAKVPGTVVGKIGVEKIFDKTLQGKFGIKKEEVNAHGRVVNEISKVNGISGQDIKLSISKKLQDFCYNRLENNTGSVVSLDLRNGEILSLVSKPSYNSNDFINEMSEDKWRSLLQNEYKPMFDRACMGTYPPGSIFKLIVTIAAMNQKDFNPYKKFFCNGGFKFGNQVFHCWKKEGHGFINCEEAISMSCDCYFYDLSLTIGIDKISEAAYSFGLGKKYLNDILVSAKGIVPNKEWKRKNFNANWTKSDTIVAAIGQGYSLSSPLQLAVMTARIATEGRMIEPTIIKGKQSEIIFSNNNFVEKNVYKLIKKGMYNTVNNANGTAYGSRLSTNYNNMAGKTATSQVRRISMLEREKGIKKNEELPREQRDHGLFVGFYPFIEPRFAFSVVVEHGGSGSKSAAPIARDLCKELKNIV